VRTQRQRHPSDNFAHVVFHRRDGKHAFTLDCSCLSADAAPLLEQGVRVNVVHTFHPFLAVVVSCCSALGCLVVHHRSGHS
jgi:hypothetical protein